MFNKVVRPLARKMFGHAGEGAVAAPNSAARILGEGATAILAAFRATRQQRLDTRSFSATKRKGALSQEWEHGNLLIVDEMSAVPPTLLTHSPVRLGLHEKQREAPT